MKDINTIVIDGEEYTISDDKKQLVGAKKKFSMKEFREEKGKKIVTLTTPPRSVREGAAFGFSDDKEFEKWLRKHGLHDNYKRGNEVVAKAKQKKSDEEYKEILDLQKKEVQATTDRFNEFLKKHNVKPGDVDKIEELLSNQDPHYEPLSHSLYLYENTWWGGYGIVLPGGTFNWWTWKISGRCFPDLGAFSFNDRASSLATWGSDHAYCYCDKYYAGAKLVAWCAIGDLNVLLGCTFGDTISSAIVY